MEKIVNYYADEVRKHLISILSCDGIRDSQVISRFLEFVVEKKLAGRASEIKEYTIGVNALGKPPGFDPHFDATVRIHAGRLRRILEQYYNGAGLNDAIRIEIPKGTYIPVFKFQRGAVKNQNFGKSVERDTPVINTLANGNPRLTLAVFPFHNYSGTDTLNYFVESIGEQLCMDLSRFHRFSVISYYSTWNYGRDGRDFREVHKAVGADYIMTGSVRFINDEVKINVQLASTETGLIIWRESYSGASTVTGLYHVQDEVVQKIFCAITDEKSVLSLLFSPEQQLHNK